MFTIYLPIAELPVNILMLIIVGLVGGFTSGMFGIGGGFIITPILIFLGVPPAVAVATSSNQVIASSVSGCIAHFKRQNVDVKMGLYLLAGGLVGGFIGLILFAALKKAGQIDLVISLSYVIFLGSLGLIMASETSLIIMREKGWIKEKKQQEIDKKARRVGLLFNKFMLPFKVNFPVSGIRVSAVLPLIIGFIAGLMVSIMGIGGGFLMIPAMIYILRMSTNKAVGTSLFQIIFTTTIITFMHATQTHTVDIILASILIIGGVTGAQFGHAVSEKFSPHKLRWWLSALVLIVSLSLAFNLFVSPKTPYSVSVVNHE